MNVSIYEQEMYGNTHWRVVRDDGRRIFDALQTDFDSRDNAVHAVRGEVRRNKMGPCRIRIHLLDRQANGRRLLIENIVG